MNLLDVTEANIAHWNKIFATRAWGKYPSEELIRFVARTFKNPTERSEMRALEIGCGTGANLWYLAREGFAIAGIDSSKHAIASAMDRICTEHLFDADRSPDLKVGNLAILPWDDNQFDIVIDIGALTSNTTAVIRSAIAEALRVLKPGGWFFGKMFGPGTTGADTGKMLEEGTTENPSLGQLKDLESFMSSRNRKFGTSSARFQEMGLDWIYRSDKNQTCNFFDWIVQARK